MEVFFWPLSGRIEWNFRSKSVKTKIDTISGPWSFKSTQAIFPVSPTLY